MEELHRLGGTVSENSGLPLAGVWIALPETGRWTASNGRGQFDFARVPAGTHRVLARTVDGRDAQTTVSVPGGTCDLIVGASARTRSRRP
jgi:hypothetical protein